MTEHVFIAWGRNQQLAEKVKEELKFAGFFPTVGGMKRGASTNTFFINSNVIQQMDNTSIAVILVQRIYNSTGNPTNEFRPNLMFEWGYLQNRLRADAIHVFLIDIKRQELPSDLLNSYTHEISIGNTDKPSRKEVRKAVQKICRLFSEDVSNIDLDGLEIIQCYDAHRASLAEIIEGKKPFNSREVGYQLLHMLQLAFYRNDLQFLRDCIKDFSKYASLPFGNVICLLDQVIRYYETTDTIGLSRHWAKSSKEYRNLETIASTLKAMRSSKDQIFNIFDVLLEDYLGLANLKMFEVSADQAHLLSARTAFKNALKEIKQFKSIHPANENFVKNFWKSYIKRNLARVYFLEGKKNNLR